MPDNNAMYDDPKDPNYECLGLWLSWRKGEGAETLCNTRIYRPTQDVLDWDKPPAETNLCLGTRHGFAYVTVTITGRTDVYVHGSGGARGLKVQLRWHNHDFTDGWQTSSTCDAWIMTYREGGAWISIADIIAKLNLR